MQSLDLSGYSILLVDDQANMRRVLRGMLLGLGVRDIAEAADGAAALEQLAARAPDIVITDWAMPVLDGLELTRMIRRSSDSPNQMVPIIIVTEKATREDVLMARNAGVNEYALKPVSPRVLYLRIASVVLHPREFVRDKSYRGPAPRRPATQRSDDHGATFEDGVATLTTAREHGE